MGRKNRNARSKSYASFADFRNTTVRFDLSKGQFAVKGYKNKHKANDNIEVSVTITDNGRGEGKNFVQFSVREDIAETMIKGYGKSWTCGVVKEGMLERLYLIPDTLGYALYTNEHSKRFYVRIPFVGERAAMERYNGTHDMRFDDFNKAYYVSVGE